MTLRELPVPTVPPDRPVRAVLARAVAVLGCLLLLTGLLAPAASAVPAHPKQAPDPHQVRLTLRQVTPQPMRPGAAMTLAGTLRNVGTTAVTVEAVRAHTGYRGLDTRSAVRSWAAGTSDVTTTRPLGEQVLERRLAPGERARFRIEVPAGTVAPPFSFASLPLLLDVAGGGEDPGTVGQLRSFLVWDGQDGYDHEPLQLSWLVPLTAPADPDLFSTDPQARAQAWEQAAGPQSRATRLVRELSGLGVTFVADPALLSPVAPGGLGPVSGEASQPATEPSGPDSRDTDEPADPTRPPAPAPTATPAPEGAAATATGLGGTGEDAGPGRSEEPEDTGAPDPSTATEGVGAGGAADPAAPLRSALAGVPASRLWWLPTGDTDLTALQQAGAGDDLADRLLARHPAENLGDTPADVGSQLGTPGTDTPPTAAELSGRGRHDVLWPVADALSETALAGLRGQWRDATGQDPAGVVVSGGTVDAGHQLTTEASLPAATAPQLQLLSYEPVLSGLLSESSAATGVADRQRLLAELLATYQEQPAARRSLLVVTPREDTSSPDRLAEHARALHALPWVRLTSAESLVGSSAPEATAPAVLTGQPAPASAVGDPAALPPVAPSPLLDGGVEQVEQVRALLTGAAEVVAGSESAAQRWHEVLDQQYSARWRGSPAWRQPLEAARAAAERVLAGVHVNPTTVNFLADEGLIQVTVVNDLDLPVENLQVDVTPRNGRLRVTEPADPVTVGPGSRATVSFRARAVAAGDVPLEVRLTTPGGTEVGEAELMNVHVQPTGTWFYWALGGLAGAVLLLGLVRTLRSPRPGQQDGDEHPKEAPAP